MSYLVSCIACIAYEVNRSYCQALGDFSQPAWEDAELWKKECVTNGVQFHMDNPDAGPEVGHEKWLEQMAKHGWIYGDVKDTELKTHPCCVPFIALAPAAQAKDYIFLAIVKQLMGADMPDTSFGDALYAMRAGERVTRKSEPGVEYYMEKGKLCCANPLRGIEVMLIIPVSLVLAEDWVVDEG